MYLTTLDDVKSLLGDLQIGVSHDAELDLRIRAVSKRAGTFCGRDFEQASYVEIHHGGEHRLYVDNPPIESVTSIEWDDFGDFDNGFTIPSVDYFIVSRGWAVAHTSGPFPGGDDGLRIEYVGGYLSASDASSTIPPDLNYAVAQQVVWEFRHRKDTGLTDVSFPDGSITKIPEKMFLPLVLDVLKMYRVPRIG